MMGDWIRLEKGRYINLDAVGATGRGPTGKGITLVFSEGENGSVTLVGTDAATAIAELEKRTVSNSSGQRLRIEQTGTAS
jgi:hypothetical protein